MPRSRLMFDLLLARVVVPDLGVRLQILPKLRLPQDDLTHNSQQTIECGCS